MIQQTLLFFAISVLLFFCLTRLGKAAFVRVYQHIKSEDEELSGSELRERLLKVNRDLENAFTQASEEGEISDETEGVLLEAIASLTLYGNIEQAKHLYNTVASDQSDPEDERWQELDEAFDRAFAFYNKYVKPHSYYEQGCS